MRQRFGGLVQIFVFSPKCAADYLKLCIGFSLCELPAKSAHFYEMSL